MTTDHPSLAPPVARLIEQLHKLPGIGPKSAQRLTYYLIRMPSEEAAGLAEAILALKEQLTFCSRCQNITESNPCTLCGNASRDQSRICVVQEPLDVLALERTAVYRGLYHVLHGVIDPMNNVGPEDLRIRELLRRLTEGQVEEVVLATNPTVEGEATAMYLRQLLTPLGVQITRLARGLPVGGDLEYADDLTLSRAFEGR
ncbi:MAG: recombination mediator RecR, partial [Dehalococcoidia bacterium]